MTYLAARPTTQAPSPDRQNDDNTPSFRHSPKHNTAYTECATTATASRAYICVATPTTPLPPGSSGTPAGHATPLRYQC